MGNSRAVHIFIEVEDGRNGITHTFKETYLGMADEASGLDMLAEYIVDNDEICRCVIRKIVERMPSINED